MILKYQIAKKIHQNVTFQDLESNNKIGIFGKKIPIPSGNPVR
jgi:hypothetical protein